MAQIRVETEIEASAATIWDVLTDFPAYAEWNPYFTEASGQAKPTARVRTMVEPSEGSPRRFVMRVKEVDEPAHLEWTGSRIAPFVFACRHVFELQPVDETVTRFIHRMSYSGVLAPLVDTESRHRDFEAMNEALARRAEQRQERVAPTA